MDSFRHDLQKARSIDDFWHYLVLLGCCLFFLDVFVRRVQVNFSWVRPALATVKQKVLRREPEAAPSEYMSRLRSRKDEVGDDIEQRRAAARFEPQPDAEVSGALEDELRGKPAAPAGPAAKKPPSSQLAPQEEEESYTSRLLKAKKKVWDERKKDQKD